MIGPRLRTLALDRARVYYFLMSGQNDREKEVKVDVTRDQKTVVIFGASSFVGSNIAEFLKRDHRVIGTYYEHPIEIEGVLMLPLDILKEEAVRLMLLLFEPDIAIYCVGLTSIETCNENEILANTLNTAGIFNVVNFCDRYGTKLIYISTGYVFSGEAINYGESDTPIPNSLYGKSKRSAEVFIQKNCLDYIILRCCELYGRGALAQKETWFEFLQKKIFEGEKIESYGNIKLGFLDVTYLATAIKVCIEKGICNRSLHFCSTDIMSHYDFSLKYAEIFHEQSSLINKKTWKFPQVKTVVFQSILALELEYKMSIGELEKALNIRMPSIQESLEFTKNRLGGGNGIDHLMKARDGVTFV